MKLKSIKKDNDLLKYIYEYSRNVDFDHVKLQALFESLGIKEYQYFGCLRTYLSNYLNTSDEDVEKIINDIIGKRKKGLTINRIRRDIKNFIASNMNIFVFCQINNISEELLNSYIEVLKAVDVELYFAYCNKLPENAREEYEDLLESIRNVVFYIQNGIEKNGYIRKFDLLDYFELINIDKQQILAVVKNVLNPDELKIFRNFVRKNSESFQNSAQFERLIFKVVITISPRYDESGNLIPGTGEIVSSETKQKVLDYLRKKNFPINQKTYNIAFRRFINNEIRLDEDVELKQ